jgi:hypothetical protein
MDNDRVRASLILGLPPKTSSIPSSAVLPYPTCILLRPGEHCTPRSCLHQHNTPILGTWCASLHHFGGRALGTHCSSSFLTYHCALLPDVSVRVGDSAYTRQVPVYQIILRSSNHYAGEEADVVRLDMIYCFSLAIKVDLFLARSWEDGMRKTAFFSVCSGFTMICLVLERGKAQASVYDFPGCVKTCALESFW